MVVQVAIDLALDRLFEYEVPEALEKELVVGQLLSVPFSGREARAFAMKIAENPSREAQERKYKLKKINKIVDKNPFFSFKTLILAEQIAKYTISPIESVLKAAVPSSVMKPGASEKLQLYVEAIASNTAPQSAGAEIKLTKRQQWLLEQIERLGGGWLNSLCNELSTTPATLRQMEKAGFVKVAPIARRRNPLANKRILPSRKLKLNSEQSAALAAINDATKPLLLKGITGSGKTEVYLQAIEEVLNQGKGAIVLVPEIALTPQTVQRFASRFGEKIAVLHSALSDGERFDEWHRIRSGEARVAVGPRSAVFAPVQNLGLIVVDEEHDTSYKQDSMPRYNARDVAVMRGALEGAKVILGSATPSLESWKNAQTGKYQLAEMNIRAGAGTLPYVNIVDMEGESAGKIYSRELLDAIRLRLDRGEQMILFLNRRGFSRSVMCENCSESIMCPNCSLAYTYHRADSCLRCHICGAWAPVPMKCPKCGSSSLVYKGIGTQRAEDALKKCFPDSKILRMDADSTSRRNSHDDILGAFRRGEAQILLGTQMIAKGLDFPNVTLVGVLNADSSLNMPDFRATERTFQLLAQVSGRAGRAELPGEVYIQTYNADDPVIRAAAKGDFTAFAKDELVERREQNLPPYTHLAAATIASKDPKIATDWATMYSKSLATFARRIASSKNRGVWFDVSEAYPSAIEKADGWFRWQITIRSQSVAAIRAAWTWLLEERSSPKEIRLTIDIDAISIV
ncbi:MAG: primosomal protein N' [Kiritimatiellae bacterium]|nr:primosomal protein N' [Kiritimatiellia bacterium]